MDAVQSSLQLMWQGMLAIFVVIAAIFIVVLLVNKVTKRKKQ